MCRTAGSGTTPSTGDTAIPTSSAPAHHEAVRHGGHARGIRSRYRATPTAYGAATSAATRTACGQAATGAPPAPPWCTASARTPVTVRVARPEAHRWPDRVRGAEFGNPVPMSGAASSNAPPVRYGWLGAAQRSADTPAGVLLMGVRLYHPAIGRFLQVDPVAGGAAGAYDYCNADPVNCTDLGGTIAWGKVLGVVAAVGEIASMIPGPIGAASAAVSAVAYAANGNKGKALEMGVTAAAALVGAGLGVRAAFKATSVSARLGQRAKRVVDTVKRVAGRACSFVPGTLVRMADGSLTPIEDLQVGDLVLAGDPQTGQTSAEAVITPLTSTGDKRLVALRFDGDVEAVVATDNHPYWVRDAGWVAAGELVVGDTTLASDGAVRTLVQTTDLGWFQDQTVHNLHVAGEHTYYVTADPAQADQLVHNAASCPVGSSGTIVNDRGVRVTIRASTACRFSASTSG